jgi:DNA-binding transcriptional regulator YiaG
VPFKSIGTVLPYDELSGMYETLHEADISKIAIIVNARLEHERHISRLAVIRNASGLTQKQLSRLSGVSLSTIRSYEQAEKDIHKAKAETLANQGQVLGCSIKDILMA